MKVTLSTWMLVLWLGLWFKVEVQAVSECSETGTTQRLQINITCDNMLDVFVDGRYIGGGQHPIITKLSIDSGSEDIAVRCKGLPNGWIGSIIASLSNGLSTDSTWKCTTRLEPGWEMTNFDDFDWSSAVEHGTNSHSLPVIPYGKKPDIPEGVKFIWTANQYDDKEIYCRHLLVPRCNARRFHIFTTNEEWNNKSLLNWALKIVRVENTFACGMKCLAVLQCVSFNIEHSLNNNKICELNSEKASAFPNNFLPRTNFQYFEVTKVGY